MDWSNSVFFFFIMIISRTTFPLYPPSFPDFEELSENRIYEPKPSDFDFDENVRCLFFVHIYNYDILCNNLYILLGFVC